MSARNRRAGHDFERLLVSEFRELGFPDARTPRFASKEKDDAGVDLCGTDPFNVQAKRWQRAPSYHEVLASMPADSNYNVIVHRRPRQGDVVVMSKADFFELVGMLKTERIL